jgi:Mg-chelatase subunit ChlD/uncharacterized protein YjdB
VTVFFILAIIYFLINIHQISYAETSNSPEINFTVKPSQSTIVKPLGQNAQGNLDIHLTPSGMSTNANRDPIDVVFIFDKSGSMNESGKNPEKFNSAKRAMTEAVSYFKANAGPRDRFAFIPFSSDVETANVVNFSPNYDVNQSLNLISQKANSLSALGGTNYTQSFEKALNLLEGSPNNKYIIFMTDGEPTFSINNEEVTYTRKKKNEKVTENLDVHYELYGSGSNMSNKVYFYDENGTSYTKSLTVSQTISSIKNHGITRANKLAEENIKLFSIGFGNDSEVDMAYLRELSSKTGVTARQANQENITSIFQDISKDISTPAIDGEVRVNLSNFNGKVNLLEGSDARIVGNEAVFKFNFTFPINQASNQPLDISFPFSFSDVGTYLFDNISLSYKKLDGRQINVVHQPVKIEVKADAPPTVKGTMMLSGVKNTVDNLMKISNAPQDTNQFNVDYNLVPFGLVNNQVTGSLSSLKIIQPLPEGVSIVPSIGVKSITYNGKPAAQIDISQSINYSNGIFNPGQLSSTLKLKADWAISNTKMSIAILQYKDSRFSTVQETSIPASNQIINMKVRLLEFPNKAYDGDSLGMLTKIDLDTKNIISQTEFPNNYDLRNKAVKDIIFKAGSKNEVIEISYYDNEKAYMYLSPDFVFEGKESGNQYQSGAITNEFVHFKLLNLVPGKNVKYYYSINDSSSWTELTPKDTIPLTKSGVNTVKLKAVGGFSIDGLIIEKTITIQRKIDSVKVEPNPIEIEVGKSIEFTATILPTDASNKQLEISIGNTKIASLSDSNRILGLTEGDTELILRTTDGSNITVTVPIYVKDPYIPLDQLKYTKTVYKIKIGDKIAIKNLLIFNPSNATQRSVTSVISSVPMKVEVLFENGNWFIRGKEIGVSTVKAIAEKQRDGRTPEDSALFEVVNSSSEDNVDPDTSGLGRW